MDAQKRIKAGHLAQVSGSSKSPAGSPGEAYVEFQLFAIERSWKEGDTNLNDWAWTPPGSEAVMKKAIQEALATPSE